MRREQQHTDLVFSSTALQSFSNLFVEFLLSEAEKAKKPPPQGVVPGSPQQVEDGAASPAKTPTRPSFNLGSLANLGRSFSSDIRSPTSDTDTPSKPFNGRKATS